jgi:hypothetical protein
MREFYRCLKRGETVAECAASAQRELEEGQEFRLEVIVELAARMLWTVYNRPKDLRDTGEHRRRRRARRVWDSWFPLHLQEQVPAYRFESGWRLSAR